MNNLRVDAIIFDKDGTLFEFGATWESWAESFLLRVTGGDRDRAGFIGTHIGFDLPRRKFAPDSVVIAETPVEIAQCLAPHFPDMTEQQIFDLLNEEAETVQQVEAVPLVPFFGQLRDLGLKLGVATNDAEAPALAHLKSAGIFAEFDFVAGCDSGHGAKPDPGQLNAFADQIGAAPERIAMVGDSTHDLHAGRNAGMRTVGVLTGIAGHPELAPFADAVFPDIGHIPQWLQD